jgi:hypothetical protein
MNNPISLETEAVEMEVTVKIVFTDPIRSHIASGILDNIVQALQHQIANSGLSPDEEDGDEEVSMESVALKYQGNEIPVWNCPLSSPKNTDKKSFSIPAEAHSDDHVIEIEFDAVDYIKNADVETLQALIYCGWGGDYPGDYVAKYYEEGVLKPLFNYLDSIKDIHSKKDQRGFECYVDGYQAQKWLAANRLEVFNKLSPF